MIKIFCNNCGEHEDECSCGEPQMDGFYTHAKYIIPSWREDYYIYFVKEHNNPIMEDGTIALMSGWKSVMNKFEFKEML